LIDFEVVKLVPAWRNFRSKEGAMYKRLDKFLVAKALMKNEILMKSFVSTDGLLDHLPIIFNLDIGDVSPPSPFKFNKVWLTEEDYRSLVKGTWVHLESSSSSSFILQFVENLARVKIVTKR
jgi:hypothetical protein